MVWANSSTSAGGLASAVTGMRPTSLGASQAMTRRSSRTSRATAGRWTLTTTLSPVRRVAAWTWAIEAAASGLRSTQRNVVQRAAEVLLDHLAHDVKRLGRHLVAAQLELVHELGGEDALARGDDLPQLDVRGPQAFRGHPEPAGDAGPADLRRAGSPLAQRPQRQGGAQSGG